VGDPKIWTRFWASRRRRDVTLTAAEILWRDLRDWFKEEDEIFHAGPELGFNDLSQRGVERLWEHLRARAEPIEPTIEIWDEKREQSVLLSDFPDAVALVHQGRFGSFIVALRGIHSGGVRLPDLGVWVSPGRLAIWWWLGGDPDWTIDTVCGFALLIGDLRDVEPGSSLDIQYSKLSELLDPIDRYLDAIKSRTAPPESPGPSNPPIGHP
jgi:hypothetical protein